MLERLAPVSLPETVVAADLQTRTDRKYLLQPEAVESMVHQFAGLRVLEIDGSRRFTYESLYFDTADLTSYHAAALGRRRRFKVRTRTYLDSGSVALEIKTRGRRGQTVKDRLLISEDAGSSAELGAEELAFVTDRTGPVALAPVLRNRYRRSTLVNTELPYRVAIDDDVEAWDLRSGRSVAYLPAVIVETKSPGPPTPVDRWLWRSNHRPVRFSKYCTSLAILDPSLPANKWHRTMQRISG